MFFRFPRQFPVRQRSWIPGSFYSQSPSFSDKVYVVRAQLSQRRTIASKVTLEAVQHVPHRVSPPSTPKVGAQSSAGEEQLSLSDLDLISPNSLVSSFLVYKLQPNDVKLVEEALRRGLEFAAEQIPPLGANIHFDNSKPRRRLSRGSVKLKVRHFDLREHKSYDELAATSFQPRDLEQGRLVPLDAYDSVEERPVLIAQLSFIPGGAILALGLNHIAADGFSRDIALTAICKASKAYMQGIEPVASATSFDFQRSRFAAPEGTLRTPKEQLISRAKDYFIIDAATRAATAKSAAAARSGITLSSQNKTVIYTIQGASVDRLKKNCKPMIGVEYLSTYDCVAAVLWRGLMRVRAQLKPHLHNDSSRMLHAVNLRGRATTGISKQYFGNAVKVVAAGPLPMPELLGPDGLSLAASSLRKSIMETSLADIVDATALGAMTGPEESLAFLPARGLADGDFMLSGWYFMNTGAYDFGMGPPAAVRPPDAGIPGFAFLFPDCERSDGSRVYEIYLTLPAVEQDLLGRDGEFSTWFHGQ